MDLDTVTAGSGSNFFSPIVDIGGLQPAPGSVPPFELASPVSVEGSAPFASVTVNAPLSSVIMSELREDNAVIVTTAASYGIENGYIVDTLRLTTPFEALYMNDQYSQPINDTGVQLFAPLYAFTFEQSYYTTNTNTFVVQYNQPVDIVDELSVGGVLGASFLHDFERMAFDGDATPTPSFDQFGMPLSYGPWPKSSVPGWSNIAPRPQVVPAVNLFVGDEIWRLVSAPSGLRIDVRRQRAH